MFSLIKRVIKYYKLSFFVTILIFLFSYLVFLLLNQNINNKIITNFTYISENFISEIEKDLDIFMDVALATGALFDSSDWVSRQEWSIFLKSQKITERYSSIKAINFIERVKSENKEDFIQKIKSEGFENFSIKPDLEKEEYLVVNYVEPFVGNEEAFGFDLSSNVERMKTANISRDTAEFVFTPPVYLVQDETFVSYIGFLPLYQNGKSINTIEERRQNLIGFSNVVFNIDFIFKNVLKKNRQTQNIHFYVTDKGKEIFNSEQEGVTNGKKVENISYTENIEIGGRILEFKIVATEEFVNSFEVNYVPLVILILGFLLGISLFFISLFLFKNKIIAQETAKEMTDKFNISQIKILNQNKDLQKFKLAVDNASDQIVITDPEGIVVYGNKAVESTTGYSANEALGKKAAVLWKVPMPDNFYKKMWQTIKEDKKTFKSEVKNKHKDGHLYDASISISPVLDEKNEVIYFVGIERDITQEKEIDRAKSEFVSLASHQLKTPLSVIGWYTEMLLGGDAGRITKKGKQFLEEIYKSNKRMVELVNSLLNISRLELGTFTVDNKKIDIIKYIKEILPEFEILTKDKKIKLHKKFHKDIPKIKADTNLLNIILQNLLSNSVKYTQEKGKIKIIVSKDTENIIINVEDNGYGIPKRQQHKIFSKMFRADNVIDKDTSGTGLGLYLVKKVLDAVGGIVSFESEENEGTTFTVKIPLEGMKINNVSKKEV